MSESIDASAIAAETASLVLAQLNAAATTPATPTLLRIFAADSLRELDTGTGRTYTAGVKLLVDGCAHLCTCDCAKCLDTAEGCGCSPDCGRCPRDGRWVGAGERHVHELTHADIERVARWARLRAQKDGKVRNERRMARGLHPLKRDGASAEENFVAAARWLFTRAINNDIALTNPATKVPKPARTAAEPRSLRPAEFGELWEATISGGDDPELDGLIIWSIAEMTLRRAGVLSTLIGGVDEENQLVTVCEKYGYVREQPCSKRLIDALLEHARSRGPADLQPTDALLYYRPKCTIVDGVVTLVPRPLTERRFDTLLARLQKALPWADLRHLRAHDIRHTSATLIDQVAGRGAAERALGHRPKRPTDNYTQGRLDMLAQANAVLTGEEHPLAHQLDRRPGERRR